MKIRIPWVVPCGLATLNWPRFFLSLILFPINLDCVVICRDGHTAPIFFQSPILLLILMGYQAICFRYQTELYIHNVKILEISETVWTLLHIIGKDLGRGKSLGQFSVARALSTRVLNCVINSRYYLFLRIFWRWKTNFQYRFQIREQTLIRVPGNSRWFQLELPYVNDDVNDYHFTGYQP